VLKLSLLTVICIANSGSAFAVQGPSWSPDLATVQKLDAEIAKSPNFDGFSPPARTLRNSLVTTGERAIVPVIVFSLDSSFA
jgi:hypothetical protein